MYYQTGPGGSNVSGGYHWTYPYGIKLTINSGVARNLEILAIGKTADGLAYRQWAEGATWTGWRTILSTNSQGRVGIGTSSPISTLDVRGHLTLEAGTNPVLYTGSGGSELSRFLLLINSPNLTSASGIKAGGVLVADMYSYANPGKNDMVVKGKVSIGTPNIDPNSILNVNGTVRSKKVKVEATSWPDYVFEPGFNLTPIDQLGKFISKNKHLPGVPSAKQILAEGFELGHMDATLLSKIEELTLYTIKQQKKIDAQQKIIQSLVERLEKLEGKE